MKPLTPDEHRALGLELAATRDRLVQVGVRIANAFRKDSSVTRFALKFTVYIDRVRALLDAEVGDPSIYYPDPEERERWWRSPK
jgi:hypothetical protein